MENKCKNGIRCHAWHLLAHFVETYSIYGFSESYCANPHHKANIIWIINWISLHTMAKRIAVCTYTHITQYTCTHTHVHIHKSLQLVFSCANTYAVSSTMNAPLYVRFAWIAFGSVFKMVNEGKFNDGKWSTWTIKQWTVAYGFGFGFGSMAFRRWVDS